MSSEGYQGRYQDDYINAIQEEYAEGINRGDIKEGLAVKVVIKQA